MALDRLAAIDRILKQFTILYQGPNIRNSLPISITSSSSFLTFKTKMLEFLFEKLKSWIGHAALTQHLIFILLTITEVASLLRLVIPWGLLAITFRRNLSLSFYKGK